MTPPVTCPRCNGTGAIRTVVKASATTGAKDTHPTVGCPLCRGTGTAMPWGQPLPGQAVPAPENREDAR